MKILDSEGSLTYELSFLGENMRKEMWGHLQIISGIVEGSN